MKTMLFAFCYILLFSSFGCSHKYGINKTHAFTRKITAGNIPVDENNRPTAPGVQTTHIIFIETAPMQDEPVWDTAWINNKAYTIKMLQVPGNQTRLGKTADEQKEVEVKAAEGNQLWQLVLTPVNASYSLSSKNAPILIRGTWKGKRVLYEIKDETELATIYAE